jgi:hypothetical protein
MTSSSAVGASPGERPPNNRTTAILARKRPLGAIALLAIALFVITSPLVTSQDDTSTPVASAATPAPDATRLELDFTELNDSGVSGTAMLYEMGAQTLVELELEGTGDDHPAHIHAGTCESIEPEASWDLNNVGNEGTSSTLVDVSLGDLLNGEYVIDLHLAPDQLGLLIACAGIAGTPVNAEGTPVAVGGESTPTSTADATSSPDATEAPDATVAPDATATTAVTPEPTGAGGEVTPTADTTPQPTVSTDATATPNDGTGGIISAETPTPSDGTAGGKGVALTPLTPPAAVGGMTTGDGTNATGATVGSGKGIAVGGPSSLPANTGSGDSLVLPTTPTGAIVWAMGGFALLLLAAGWLLRRGETNQASGRWRRLGL